MLQVLVFFILLAALIAAAVVLASVGELQTTVSFVLDKGGIWLRYTTGIGKLRMTGIQVRIMPGHHPRAWKMNPLTKKYKQDDVGLIFRSAASKRWKPIQIPLRSALDIGIKVIIRELDVKAKIGIEGDAASTALVCGMITTLLQVLRAASTRGEFVPRGFVVVQPVFSHARLSVRIQCILAIKARHIIREMVENHTRRNNDGQSSDRKHHADHDGKPAQYG